MRIEELGLPIGTRFTLTIFGQDYKRHVCDATLVGLLARQSVLVTIPHKPPQVLLHTGLVVNAEVTTGLGKAYFESSVEEIRSSGVTYLELEYPAMVQFDVVRQHMRFEVDTPVNVNAHTGLGMTVNAIHGQMLDISSTGAKLVLEKELTNMVVKITLAVFLSDFGMERDLSVEAVVRNSAEPSTDYPQYTFAYGIEYLHLDTLDAYFLQCLCMNYQLMHKQLPC